MAVSREPVANHDEEADEGIVVLELRTLRSEDDVLALDDTLEVAGGQCFEGSSDVAVEEPACTGLSHELLHGDHVVSVHFHGRNLPVTLPRQLDRTVQFELHVAGRGVVHRDHLELLTSVDHRVDVSM